MLAVAGLVGYAAAFGDGIVNVIGHWRQEEYSHGYLIPVLSLLLAWQKRRELIENYRGGSWAGLATILLGLVLLAAGDLGSLYIVIHAGIYVSLIGMVLAATGLRGLKVLWAPLVYLLFMFPLPDFFYNTLSLKLQLLSSEGGVWFIRLLGISVFLDGNLIDMGTYKLEVVEACSGLRYLFPLMSFGFIGAYFMRIPLWAKIVLFASTIPLTIAINSFRIAVTGILVESYGPKMAEGFIHHFEGWVIFMSCVLLLFFEGWLLSRLMRPPPKLGDFLKIDFLDNILPGPVGGATRRPSNAAFVSFGTFAILSFALSGVMSGRTEIIPERTSFATFPLKLEKWYGQRTALERTVIEELDADDFIVANYRRMQDRLPVNLYIAYYGSQRAGAAAHSPETCLPGGGWRVEEWSVVELRGPSIPDGFYVNRAVIRKGDARQLAYYWFRQRDRHVTDSYAVKWYLFVDSIARNRTDGALVRLLTFVEQGGDVAAAEQRLLDFLGDMNPRLEPYLPG